MPFCNFLLHFKQLIYIKCIVLSRYKCFLFNKLVTTVFFCKANLIGKIYGTSIEGSVLHSQTDYRGQHLKCETVRYKIKMSSKCGWSLRNNSFLTVRFCENFHKFWSFSVNECEWVEQTFIELYLGGGHWLIISKCGQLVEVLSTSCPFPLT